MLTSQSAKRSLLVVGCGYLGLRVVRMAAEAGWQVFGTSRRIEKKAEIEAHGGTFVHFDIIDEVSQANLPAVESWLWCPAFDRRQNLPVHDVVDQGLVRSLYGAIHKPEQVVFTSTTSVYHQDSGEWVDENSPTLPVTDSGKAHLAAEKSVEAWGVTELKTWRILRLSGLYGPGRWIRRNAIQSGEAIPCMPETWLNLLHIDDAASACMAALAPRPGTNQSLGVFCVSDDRPILRREFYETSARLLNAPTPKFLPPSNVEQVGNKRVANERIKNELVWLPAFADINTGLINCL